MMPPRAGRILITTDAVGGVWTYSTTLARGLVQRGYDVVLVTMGPAPRVDQLAGLKGIPGLTVEPTDFALEWMDPEGRDFDRTAAGLLAIARRTSPDLVHLNSYREGAIEWPAPLLVAAHSCVGSWAMACRGEPLSEHQWIAYALNVRAGLAAADGWVAPTKAFRDSIRAIYAPLRIGDVIHNGMDAAGGTITKEPFILAAGRLWDEAKNVRALIETAPETAWPIRIAGPHRGDVPDSVEMLGELRHGALLELMARASVFAAPALYEPFGLSILEAASAGCALVLSDIPSLRELWASAALFVDPRDPRDLAAALQIVCMDQDVRENLQRAARQRARRYSTARMIDAYEAQYARLLGSHSISLYPAMLARSA
jgi:glycosyltransferase involved in cell wall biosynthesis